MFCRIIFACGEFIYYTSIEPTPVDFDPQFFGVGGKECPCNFWPIGITFRDGRRVGRLIEACMRFQDDDVDMPLYRGNLRLLDVCQTQQLEIHRATLLFFAAY